ncbi:MAG TPA: dipeptidase [Candidatus Thermoplasmatota archaeon]|nr:dipeptidase [Candidatus Thermoplasmatota archaeon]
MPESPPVEHARANQERHLSELFEFLRIPSVSAQPSKHQKDVERAAQFVADAMRGAGLENVELIPTPGNPLVYGDWLHAPGAPTVLVYGHYDVQPPEPLDLWDSPPFEPTVRDGKIYARGATDDKGQMYAHVKGVEAHLRTTGKLPVNVKFLIEGEEEVGSKNLHPAIERERARLGCDVVLVSDTAMKAMGQPAITYSLRGLIYFQVDVVGPKSDLHSGTWGGSLANPNEALVQALAKMKDAKTGKVKIPGFYDGIKVDRKEREAIKKSGYPDSYYKKEMALKALWGEKGWSAAERTSVRPTFEINGVYGGYQGEGAKTVIPAHAHAKVSMRLVQGQDAAKITKNFEKHLKSVMLPGVEVTVTRLSAGMGAKVPLDHPAMQAGAKALQATFGKKPLFLAEGGSIPVVATFQRVLGVSTVLMGFGLHDENLHAPNEHFRVENYHKGIEASARFFDELARVRLDG